MAGSLECAACGVGQEEWGRRWDTGGAGELGDELLRVDTVVILSRPGRPGSGLCRLAWLEVGGDNGEVAALVWRGAETEEGARVPLFEGRHDLNREGCRVGEFWGVSVPSNRDLKAPVGGVG